MSQLFDSAQPQPSGHRDVDARRLAEDRPPALHCVDVREPAELEGVLGSIQGVRSVPLATVREASALWPRDTELLLICRSGARSARAAAQLVEQGFTRVMNLRGGMLAWNTEALPVVRLTPGAPPTLSEVRDALRARLQGVSSPELESLRKEEPSREALTAALEGLQATPPVGLTDTAGFERMLREVRDLLAIARPGDTRR